MTPRHRYLAVDDAAAAAPAERKDASVAPVRTRAEVERPMVQLREGSPTWPLSERAGEIETLSVLPSERGKGTGSALLEAVRSELASHGVVELSLHVMHTNGDAMRFYERHGFETYAIWVSAGAKRP